MTRDGRITWDVPTSEYRVRRDLTVRARCGDLQRDVVVPIDVVRAEPALALGLPDAATTTQPAASGGWLRRTGNGVANLEKRFVGSWMNLSVEEMEGSSRGVRIRTNVAVNCPGTPRLAFSPDGQYVFASFSNSDFVHIKLPELVMLHQGRTAAQATGAESTSRFLLIPHNTPPAVDVFDVATLKHLHTIEFPEGTKDIRLHASNIPDIVYADSGNNLYKISLPDGQPVLRADLSAIPPPAAAPEPAPGRKPDNRAIQHRVSAVMLAPDGRYLAYERTTPESDRQTAVYVIDLQPDEPRLIGRVPLVTSVSRTRFSTDGAYLASITGPQNAEWRGSETANPMVRVYAMDDFGKDILAFTVPHHFENLMLDAADEQIIAVGRVEIHFLTPDGKPSRSVRLSPERFWPEDSAARRAGPLLYKKDHSLLTWTTMERQDGNTARHSSHFYLTLLQFEANP